MAAGFLLNGAKFVGGINPFGLAAIAADFGIGWAMTGKPGRTLSGEILWGAIDHFTQPKELTEAPPIGFQVPAPEVSKPNEASILTSLARLKRRIQTSLSGSATPSGGGNKPPSKWGSRIVILALFALLAKGVYDTGSSISETFFSPQDASQLAEIINSLDDQELDEFIQKLSAGGDNGSLPVPKLEINGQEVDITKKYEGTVTVPSESNSDKQVSVTIENGQYTLVGIENLTEVELNEFIKKLSSGGDNNSLPSIRLVDKQDQEIDVTSAISGTITVGQQVIEIGIEQGQYKTISFRK